MAITFKKNDDLEKMLENFATLPKMEAVTFPDPKNKDEEDKEDAPQSSK